MLMRVTSAKGVAVAIRCHRISCVFFPLPNAAVAAADLISVSVSLPDAFAFDFCAPEDKTTVESLCLKHKEQDGTARSHILLIIDTPLRSSSVSCPDLCEEMD